VIVAPARRPAPRRWPPQFSQVAADAPSDGPVDIELEKLISDSLYLDNQAHVVVMRMRDMDSGTKEPVAPSL